MIRRPTFVTVLVAALALGTLAFAQPRTVGYPDLGMVPGTAGGTVTLALGDSPPRFLYYGEISNVSQTLTQQMFDSLVEFDLENYELVPGLAASWDVTENGTVYTFHLREGVTWHDGVPFSADDVVFTYEQIITNPEARAGDAANFQFTVDGEARRVTFEAVDQLTVRMTLPAPSAAFLLQQRFFIMPKHKLLPFSVEGGAEPADINVSKLKKGTAAAVMVAAAMPRGPRQSKGFTAAIDEKLCRGCGRCTDACLYHAMTLQANGLGGWRAQVDEALCKGCGNCISVCPTGAHSRSPWPVPRRCGAASAIARSADAARALDLLAACSRA